MGKELTQHQIDQYNKAQEKKKLERATKSLADIQAILRRDNTELVGIPVYSQTQAGWTTQIEIKVVSK